MLIIKAANELNLSYEEHGFLHVIFGDNTIINEEELSTFASYSKDPRDVTNALSILQKIEDNKVDRIAI